MSSRRNDVHLRRLATGQLTEAEITAIRALLEDAFGSDEEEAFTQDDWDHAVGGVHFVLEGWGEIVAHASVVERELHVGGRPVRTGYVEAVATAPVHQRNGYGSAVMRDVGEYIRERFELGALGTGSHAFYERLGWETWRGPTSVRTADGNRLRSASEDGGVMVLRTARTPQLSLDEPVAIDWRAEAPW